MTACLPDARWGLVSEKNGHDARRVGYRICRGGVFCFGPGASVFHPEKEWPGELKLPGHRRRECRIKKRGREKEE